MGTSAAVFFAFALYDSNGCTVSLEFSLAAILSSRTGDLRGRGPASKAWLPEPSYSRTLYRCFDERCSVNLPYNWSVRFSAHLDPYWTSCGLVVPRISSTGFESSAVGTRCDHVWGVAGQLSLYPYELRSPQIQFISRVAQTGAPRSAATLSQRVSMGRTR